MALDVSRGGSGAAPRWSVSLAVGTAFAYIGGVGHLHDPAAQIEETFGGGRHGLAPVTKHGGTSSSSGSPGNSGSAPGHTGTAGNGVGHGNGRKKTP
jgi:hypothetical protein